MKNKKGAAVWVSAVLYFGIGIVILTIVLTAGMPTINRMKDKNIILQTEKVMHLIDGTIRDVIRGGPGNQRVITLDLKKGNFYIDDSKEAETITWSYTTKALLSEPGEVVHQGNLNILTTSSPTVGEYDISLFLDYSKVANLTFKGGARTLTGISDLVIRNERLSDGSIHIIIEELS